MSEKTESSTRAVEIDFSTLTVVSKWEQFRDHVLKRDAPEYVVESIRNAFYAGAASTFGICIKASDLEDDGANEVFDSIHNELTSYTAKLPKAAQAHGVGSNPLGGAVEE